MYLYWTVQEREVLLNVNCRGSQSVKELFNEVTDSVVVLAPQAIQKEDYLVVLKEFRLSKGE